MYDYLIVGAGISGCVLAERISTVLNKTVLLIEKRDHVGGNCYDFVNENGVLVHKYGPHYFRTDDDEVYSYLSNFTEWIDHTYKVKVFVNGELYSFPINLATLRKYFKNESMTSQEAENLLEHLRDKSIVSPRNAQEEVVSKIGWELYNSFFKDYTEKQWGIPVTELEPSVTSRIPIRTNMDDSYVRGKIQSMPKNGYTKMFERMLSVPLNSGKISLRLSTIYSPEMRKLAKNIIWTGCIDEFYNFKFGKLPYRSLRFEFKDLKGVEFHQVCEQINYPEKRYPYTRIVEIKHVTHQDTPNTTLSIEYPSSEGEPFYPVPSSKNDILYKKYYEESLKDKNIYFVGRLAKYKYINMDQTVRDSLDLFYKIKDESVDESKNE